MPKPTTGIDYLGPIDRAHATDLSTKVNYALAVRAARLLRSLHPGCRRGPVQALRRRNRRRQGRAHLRAGPGRVGGRRPKLTEEQAALAQRLYAEREKTVQQIADMFGVPRSTVYGRLDKAKTVPRQPKKVVVTKP
ncbi:helix-turn-helix domain-containing protein [Streptomyces sp. NPDC002676]